MQTTAVSITVPSRSAHLGHTQKNSLPEAAEDRPDLESSAGEKVVYDIPLAPALREARPIFASTRRSPENYFSVPDPTITVTGTEHAIRLLPITAFSSVTPSGALV